MRGTLALHQLPKKDGHVGKQRLLSKLLRLASLGPDRNMACCRSRCTAHRNYHNGGRNLYNTVDRFCNDDYYEGAKQNNGHNKSDSPLRIYFFYEERSFHQTHVIWLLPQLESDSMFLACGLS